MDEPEEYIDFMAKYKEWVSIKRLGIRPTTKPEEIVYHLAGIRSTIDTKGYPFLGINTKALDGHAERMCAGLKKSYASLASAINAMSSPETKRVIEQSSGKQLAQIAEAYLLGKVITTVGYETGINQLLMSKAFSDLKPPRMPGRKGKGKKGTEE